MSNKEHNTPRKSYPVPVKTTTFPIHPNVTKKYDKALELIKEIVESKNNK
ncbi:hypothetical protein [Halobacillus litoralis]|nr:hypothetical protein [Halobacillus litoralis]